jgi:exonuclease III
MTMNIRQGAKHKIPILMDHLHAKQIDIAFVTETGIAAKLTDIIQENNVDDREYIAHQTGLEHAGATILIRKQWNHTIVKTQIIHEGRVIALTLITPEGAQILLVCAYQKSGLQNMSRKDPKLLKARANIHEIIALMGEDTSLVICAGDFNDCNSNTDRIRTRREEENLADRENATDEQDGVDTRSTQATTDRDATFSPLLGLNFIDTHDQGEDLQNAHGKGF